MEFDPPIKERSDKELFEIIENRDDWEPEALNQAQSELIERGVSIGKQNNRSRSKRKFESRVSKIKASSRYSTLEMVLLVTLGIPFCLFFSDLEIFWPGEGFKTKNRQGILALLLGILFWGLLLYLVVVFF
ncbi:hypothetical protein [Flagellimonas pacifica]|uniref:Uncharacterized protein n=1 Tax=Flagellimonas pacifica TaxID=1247520 RepID=A0A285MS78_9FLAO|nr:hypothetical protein [Allomuricauda parva]SNZ00025.1 hypothetical protein SAMN06265377_1842 [Allomuricauda parva]